MDEEERFLDEFGHPLPRYNPVDPDKRLRHDSFASAAEAAFKDLTTVKNPFFDALAEKWKSIFPRLAAKPGRLDDGKLFLYVANAPTNFALRPRLPAIKKKILSLPGAPKKLDVRLEIHS